MFYKRLGTVFSLLITANMGFKNPRMRLLVLPINLSGLSTFNRLIPCIFTLYHQSLYFRNHQTQTSLWVIESDDDDMGSICSRNFNAIIRHKFYWAGYSHLCSLPHHFWAYYSTDENNRYEERFQVWLSLQNRTPGYIFISKNTIFIENDFIEAISTTIAKTHLLFLSFEFSLYFWTIKFQATFKTFHKISVIFSYYRLFQNSQQYLYHGRIGKNHHEIPVHENSFISTFRGHGWKQCSWFSRAAADENL